MNVPPQVLAKMKAQAMQVAAAQRQAKLGAYRRRSPMRTGGPGPVLEQIIKPLYDTESFVSGGVDDLRFFARPIGQAAISGNTKTLRDTNLLTAGSIPNPKVAVIVGFRVVASLISGDNDATPTVVIPTQTEMADLIRSIYWETVTEFTLGSKIYVKRPTWQLPGNTGLDVNGWASSDGGTGASTVTEADAFPSYYATGPYGAYTRTRLRLPPLQQFTGRIFYPGTRRHNVPSSGSSIGTKVTMIADAIEGREVQ